MTGTSMTPTYALFERVLRVILESRPATNYECDVERARPDGRTYTSRVNFSHEERHEVPWGVNDAIRKVTWRTDGRQYAQSPADAAWSIGFTPVDHTGAIMVYINSGMFNEYGVDFGAVGVAGVIRPGPKHYLTLESEDAVIDKLTQLVEDFHRFKASRDRDLNDRRFDDGGESWSRMFHGDGVEY